MAGTSKQQREQRRRQREYEARVVVHDVGVDRLRRDNRMGIALLAVTLVVGVASALVFGLTQPEAADPAAEATATSAPESTDAGAPDATAPERTLPAPEVAEAREWTGELVLNDSIALGITIDGAQAPQAAANFIALAGSRYYDATPCHRLTTQGIFVLQCGDPTGTGTGGPGYTFGPLENVPADDVYPAGTIAMARAQAPDSMGSQFFIVYEETRLPAPGYTVFGQVTSGLDELVAQIAGQGVAGGAGDGAPAVPVSISSVTLE